MKVHRIIAIIEVENDNSITSVELIKLSLDNIEHPLVITNITTNGSANNIKQVYDSIDKRRLDIAIKLKSIARSINDGLDDYECGIIGRDYNDSECNDETKAD
jgi:transcriptional regulatory protein LevR